MDAPSPASGEQRPSIWSELAPTLAWLGLFVLACVIGFLLLYPGHVRFESPDRDIPGDTVCSSVVVAGWPRTMSDDASRGVDDAGSADYDRATWACQSRRTTYVAGIAVLSMPVALLGCWLIASRPHRRPRVTEERGS